MQKTNPVVQQKRKPAPSHVDPNLASGSSPGRNYFSILQASDYCAATPSWIEDQLRNGGLPYRWAGNRRVIFRRDLDALMESLPVESGLCDVPAFMQKEQAKRVS